MKKIEFVTRSSDQHITIPARLYENLEGLDLLVTIKPIVVEIEENKKDEGPDKYRIKDWNPSPISQLHPGIKEKEDREAFKQAMIKHVKEIHTIAKENYDEMLGGEGPEISPPTTNTIRLIQEVIIESANNGITLTFIYDKENRKMYATNIKDKYMLKTALDAQYADTFKLTIRSAPLYEELTSIVFHFFSPRYKLTDTFVHLDDYTDTYQKDKDFERRKQADFNMRKQFEKLAKEYPEKEKQWAKYKELKEVTEAVLKGELRPEIYEEDGIMKIRYVKNDDQKL